MSWNILYGYTSYVDNYCANDQIISLGPKGLIETNISKNSCFHDDKSFWHVFPRIIDCDQHQGTIYKGPQNILTFTLEHLSEHFLDLRGCWKHKVFKKRQFFQWRKNFGLFSSFYRTWKAQGTVYRGPQDVSTTIVQMMRTFLWHLRGR